MSKSEFLTMQVGMLAKRIESVTAEIIDQNHDSI